jgi:hypothetical protein
LSDIIAALEWYVRMFLYELNHKLT